MEPRVLTIEYAFDFVCPWSYIFKKRLMRAVRVAQSMRKGVEFNIIWRPFILHPNMLNQTKQTLVQGLVESKGPAKANKILEGLKEAAAAEGLPIHFNGPVGSTGMAHTLVAVAAEFGKSEELVMTSQMIDRLFHAFFVEQRDITSYTALYPIFDEFDFDRKWLKEQEYGLKLKPVVKNLIEENSNIGITGTPFVIFNKTFGLAGAHPVDKLMFIMDALLNNEQPSELTSVMFQPTPTEE